MQFNFFHQLLKIRRKKRNLFIHYYHEYLIEKINFTKNKLKLTKNKIELKAQKLLLDVEIWFKKAEKDVKKATNKKNRFKNLFPFYTKQYFKFQKCEELKKIKILKKNLKLKKKIEKNRFNVLKIEMQLFVKKKRQQLKLLKKKTKIKKKIK